MKWCSLHMVCNSAIENCAQVNMGITILTGVKILKHIVEPNTLTD